MNPGSVRCRYGTARPARLSQEARLLPLMREQTEINNMFMYSSTRHIQGVAGLCYVTV